jgi:radical SAM protein (TIGR01212 family)
VGTGGCIFCSAYGGGEFAEGGAGSVAEQLQRAKARVQAKAGNGKYIAYFQSFSGTYAPVERLERLYLDAMAPDDIVGLSIGTRPDCLSDEVINLLSRLNRLKPISVELGLQTIHPNSVHYIRRGYGNQVYQSAIQRLKAAGIEVVTHIIIGLPGENAEMAAQTTRFAIGNGTDGVKFHLLHVLRGTDLEQDYLAGRFDCLSLEEYARTLKRCLEQVPPHVVVHRITGDGAKRDLVAPLWSANKKAVLNYLNRFLNT